MGSSFMLWLRGEKERYQYCAFTMRQGMPRTKRVLHFRPGLEVNQVRLKCGAVALWDRALHSRQRHSLERPPQPSFNAIFLAVPMTYNKCIYCISYRPESRILRPQLVL